MRRAAILAAGAAALGAAWLISPPTTAPLYDGAVQAPPYRYFCNPPADQHVAATGRSETDPLINGASPAIAFTTTEPNVPQVQVLIGAGAITLPPGATDVTVEAAPIVPPSPLPSDGKLDGNVYAVSISAGGQPAQLGAGQVATVVLRGPMGAGTSLVIERFDGSRWSQLTTQPVGQADIFGANTNVFGTVALVIPGQPPSTPGPCATLAPAATGSGSSDTGGGGGGDQGSSTGITIAAILIAVALVGGAGLLFFLRRGDGAPPPKRGASGKRRRPPPRR